MPKFNSKTASEAGKKSKRKRDKQISDLRDLLIDLTEENKEKLKEALNRVFEQSPSRYIDQYIKLLAFVIPKADSEVLREIRPIEPINLPPWMTTKESPTD